MQEYIKPTLKFLSEHAMDLFVFIAGALGASQRPNISDGKLTRKQRYIAITLGGVTSVILTNFFVFLIMCIFGTDLNVNLYPAVGYFLGHLGLQQITDLMLKWGKKADKDER